ncbi:hypothetical protein BVH74_04100 [Halopseudomonas phragmitis]|uniref:Uncharacterized protein n=1 Tax=Halopseudomonas phragmitis TaxID=1931241 RepID=A0A1V0B216_9GAMM|nr:hypothetical protein BVH74_04100 [Halopseudomonas phragmitis]
MHDLLTSLVGLIVKKRHHVKVMANREAYLRVRGRWGDSGLLRIDCLILQCVIFAPFLLAPWEGIEWFL